MQVYLRCAYESWVVSPITVPSQYKQYPCRGRFERGAFADSSWPAIHFILSWATSKLQKEWSHNHSWSMVSWKNHWPELPTVFFWSLQPYDWTLLATHGIDGHLYQWRFMTIRVFFMTSVAWDITRCYNPQWHVLLLLVGSLPGRFRADEKGFQLSASPFFLILNTAQLGPRVHQGCCPQAVPAVVCGDPLVCGRPRWWHQPQDKSKRKGSTNTQTQKKHEALLVNSRIAGYIMYYNVIFRCMCIWLYMYI